MSSLSGKKVSVVGIGLSGVAAAKLIQKHGGEVFLTDDKSESQLKDAMNALKDIPANFRLGGIDSELLIESDLTIISPGVPSDLPPLEQARRAGVDIISEIELAYQFCNAPVIAITGTNGKTTTTSLTHHIVTKAGLTAALGGNIEIPFSQVVDEGSCDAIVLEISSFQLENIRAFRPLVSVMLNISSDHLDRYTSMDEYIDAKMQIFRNQSAAAFSVLNKDDPVVASMADGLKTAILWFSANTEVDQGVFLKDELIIARFDGDEKRVMHVDKIPLLGRHNVENTLAAIAATLPLRLPFISYEPAVADFPGVEHRLEKVREHDGVLFVNDSKATNVGALEKSLNSFDRPIILIAGGRGKNSDYRSLRNLVEEKLKAMITIGEDAPLLEEALGAIITAERSETLADAVEKAVAMAEAGDCVLLAPACASFDMFKNYRHRGDVFKEAVWSI